MNLQEILKRIAEINEKEIPGAADQETIDKLVEERKALLEKKEELEALETRKQQALAIQNGQVVARALVPDKQVEVRNTKAYVDAFANYVKTGKDAECRALLTTNATDGTIAVPDLVYDEIKTAWDRNEIMSLVNRIEVKGNMKVQFEISGTDAVVHDEGSGAVAEETLTEGIVTLVPEYVKKWISFSDEVMSMRGEAFLRYIYRELSHKIIKKMADILVAKISALTTSASSTQPSVAQITAAPAMATVSDAIGHLSDDAENPVIIMNKLTYSAFKAVQYANGYSADPFEGLTVRYNNSLPAYSAANTNDVYMIVGDLGYGAMANFPNGNAIEFKFDDLSKKKEDMIEVLGKEYAAIGVVACGAFCQVKKPAVI